MLSVLITSTSPPAGMIGAVTASIEVVAAVIRHGGRVLTCRRAEGRAAGGKWEFPGGKVSAGESQQAALEREILEELGVAIWVGGLLDRSVTPVGEVEIDLSCYFAAPVGDLPTSSSDHDEIRWLGRSELMAFDWAEPDLAAVEKLATEDEAWR